MIIYIYTKYDFANTYLYRDKYTGDLIFWRMNMFFFFFSRVYSIVFWAIPCNTLVELLKGGLGQTASPFWQFQMPWSKGLIGGSSHLVSRL